MKRLLLILCFSSLAIGQESTIGKSSGIVRADQEAAESVSGQIDKAALACRADFKFCPVLIPPSMGGGEPSGMVPGVTFLDLRKGIYLKSSGGYEENVLGQGIISRLFTIKDYSNTTDNHLHASMLIENCMSTSQGRCAGGSLTENNSSSLSVWQGRPAGTTDAAQPLSVFLREESGTGLMKGQMRVAEFDLANFSGASVMFNSSAPNGDQNNTGVQSDCVGRGNCGIGLLITSNMPATAPWERGAVISHWAPDGYGLHMLEDSLHGASPAAVVLDSTSAGANECMQWNDGGPPNPRWSICKSGADDLLIRDIAASANRFVAAHGSSANTTIAAIGAGAVVMQGGGGVQLPTVTFASLPAANNGTLIYCADCTVSLPASCMNVTTAAACSCSRGGTGAVAKRINGAWLCQ
jgi:hypothetical protein